VRLFVFAISLLGIRNLAHAQASLSGVSVRPFVIGVIPVVGGNGAVGGVTIDAQGAISLADVRNAGAINAARRVAQEGIAGDATRPSKLRKISLRRLDALLAAHASRNQPLPPEVLCHAGLQRIEYLFAYPDRRDVILAGPAGAWGVDDAGRFFGTAALELVDLVTALRSTDKLLAGEPISCSIDPTPAGLERLARLTRGGRVAPAEKLLEQMEHAVGPQTITLTGVSPRTHFAQVLVAADWQMKRLAMGLAALPLAGKRARRG
jgi:hypothetical protein